METKKTSRLRVGNVIACTIMLLVFVFVMIAYTSTDGGSVQKNSRSIEQSEVIPLLSKDVRSSLLSLLVYQNEVKAGPKEEVVIRMTELDDYITTYLDDIEFLSYTLSVDHEDIIKSLYEQYEKYYDTYGFDETNVGYLLNADGTMNSYDNAKYGLVEYIYDYVDKYPEKQTTRRVAYTDDALYVENLIRYYTSIYNNVDTNLALSIGAAESGYYKVKYMLSAGNVYGGMSGGKLIHYNNIEIGVLSYVRLLSKSYFGKGLKTVQSIGYKYNPIIDENGNKIASPHWVGLVNTAMKHYEKLDNNITAKDLLEE